VLHRAGQLLGGRGRGLQRAGLLLGAVGQVQRAGSHLGSGAGNRIGAALHLADDALQAQAHLLQQLQQAADLVATADRHWPRQIALGDGAGRLVGQLKAMAHALEQQQREHRARHQAQQHHQDEHHPGPTVMGQRGLRRFIGLLDLEIPDGIHGPDGRLPLLATGLQEGRHRGRAEITALDGFDRRIQLGPPGLARRAGGIEQGFFLGADHPGLHLPEKLVGAGSVGRNRIGMRAQRVVVDAH